MCASDRWVYYLCSGMTRTEFVSQIKPCSGLKSSEMNGVSFEAAINRKLLHQLEK